MDEPDDFTRWQDDSQYNHAEDARPDLHGIAASVAAGGCSMWVKSRPFASASTMSALAP